MLDHKQTLKDENANNLFKVDNNDESTLSFESLSHEELLNILTKRNSELSSACEKYSKGLADIDERIQNAQKLEDKYKVRLLELLNKEKAENVKNWLNSYKSLLLLVTKFMTPFEKFIIDKSLTIDAALELINKSITIVSSIKIITPNFNASFLVALQDKLYLVQTFLLLGIIARFVRLNNLENECVKNSEDLLEALNEIPDIMRLKHEKIISSDNLNKIDEIKDDSILEKLKEIPFLVQRQQGKRIFFFLYLAKKVYSSLKNNDKVASINKQIESEASALQGVFAECQNLELIYLSYLDYIYKTQGNINERDKNCELMIEQSQAQKGKKYLPSILFVWDNIINYYNDKVIGLGLYNKDQVLEYKTFEQIYTILNKAFLTLEYVYNKVIAKEDYSFSVNLCKSIDNIIVLFNDLCAKATVREKNQPKKLDEKSIDKILGEARESFSMSCKVIILIRMIETLVKLDPSFPENFIEEQLYYFKNNISEFFINNIDLQKIKDLHNKYGKEFKEVAVIDLYNKLEKFLSLKQKEKRGAKSKSSSSIPDHLKGLVLDEEDIKFEIRTLEANCLDPNITRKNFSALSSFTMGKIDLAMKFKEGRINDLRNLNSVNINVSLEMLLNWAKKISIYNVMGHFSKREDFNEDKLYKEEFKHILYQGLMAIKDGVQGISIEQMFFVIHLGKNFYLKDNSEKGQANLIEVERLLEYLNKFYAKNWLFEIDFIIYYYNALYKIYRDTKNHALEESTFIKIEELTKAQQGDGYSNNILMCFELYIKRYLLSLIKFSVDIENFCSIEEFIVTFNKIDRVIFSVYNKFNEIKKQDNILREFKEVLCIDIDLFIKCTHDIVLRVASNIMHKKIAEVMEENALEQVKQFHISKKVFDFMQIIVHKNFEYLQIIETLIKDMPNKDSLILLLASFKSGIYQAIKEKTFLKNLEEGAKHIDKIITALEKNKSMVSENAEELLKKEEKKSSWKQEKLEKEKKDFLLSSDQQEANSSEPDWKIKNKDYKLIYTRSMQDLKASTYDYSAIEEDLRNVIKLANENEDERFATIGELGLAKLSFESAKRVLPDANFAGIQDKQFYNSIALALEVLNKFELLKNEGDIKECYSFLIELYLNYAHFLLNLNPHKGVNIESNDNIEKSLFYYNQVEIMGKKINDDSAMAKAFLGRADYHIIKALRINAAFGDEYELQLEAFISRKAELILARDNADLAFSFASRNEKAELIKVTLLTIESLHNSINECKNEIKKQVDILEESRRQAMQRPNWGMKDFDAPDSRMAQLRRAFIAQYGSFQDPQNGECFEFNNSYKHLSEEVQNLYMKCKNIAEKFEPQVNVRSSSHNNSLNNNWVNRVSSSMSAKDEGLGNSI